MAITHISLVNQKLVYAGTLIALATGQGEPLTTSQRLVRRALEDSVLMQLELAYRFYLRELGENYQLKQFNQISDAAGLVATLVAANKSPSEAQELFELERTPGSWLAQLLAAASGLSRSPEPQKPAKAFVDANTIALVDVTGQDSPDEPLSLDDLSSWLAEFRNLILRQRETSAEY